MIVDDQDIDREVVRLALEFYEDLQVIGEAQDGSQITGMIRRLLPDVVVIDVDNA